MSAVLNVTVSVRICFGWRLRRLIAASCFAVLRTKR